MKSCRRGIGAGRRAPTSAAGGSPCSMPSGTRTDRPTDSSHRPTRFGLKSMNVTFWLAEAGMSIDVDSDVDSDSDDGPMPHSSRLSL